MTVPSKGLVLVWLCLGFSPPPKKKRSLGSSEFKKFKFTSFNLYFYCTGQSEARDQWRSQLIACISRADRSFNPQSANVCSRHFEEHCFVTRKHSLLVARMSICFFCVYGCTERRVGYTHSRHANHLCAALGLFLADLGIVGLLVANKASTQLDGLARRETAHACSAYENYGNSMFPRKSPRSLR